MAERAELDETTIAYEDTGGNGPAVLFIHGLGGSANGWLAQLEACRERGWRGIAHDARGAGRTAAGEGTLSAEGWAADACALLDHLGVERAALVGHSVGCMVAERAAHLLGRRAWALALCGGAIEWPEAAGPVFAERARLARAGMLDRVAEAVAAAGLSERCRREDPRLLGLMREAIASNDPESYARGAEATAAAAMRDPGELRLPVLAFCGSEDPVTPPSATETIAAAVPGAVSGLVEGAGHWCMLEDPAATNTALFAFLDGVRGSVG